MESHLLQMRGLKHKEYGNISRTFRSHLLQMRGLKHIQIGIWRLQDGVASFTDAWIETTTRRTPSGPAVSHLLQMRGLKLL